MTSHAIWQGDLVLQFHSFLRHFSSFWAFYEKYRYDLGLERCGLGVSAAISSRVSKF
jgi:hypothetical protein